MRNITRASIALIGAVALTGVTAMSASAAVIEDLDDGSAATVVVQGGFLNISVPETLALTSPGPGETATGSLGTVTVTDETAGIAGWTAAISVADFVLGSDATKTLPATGFTYAPTAATTTTSTGTIDLGTEGTSFTGLENAAPVDVKTATVVGNNVATWTATVGLAVPANSLAGSYTATVTHSLL